MCGIVGFFDPASRNSRDQSLAFIDRMGKQVHHRGPDGKGGWVDEKRRVALGHQRLSILDLSDAGHQPMLSSNERYVLTFNGEIYNHLRIRHELEKVGAAPNWRGHSDTETLLAGIEYWGVEGVLEHIVGMFAFAVWDIKEEKLIITRDRLGEKPLYYGWQDGVFLFGSELKALRAHPSFKNIINRDALSLLLRYNSIPAPYAIYTGISKLSPGKLLVLRADNEKINIKTYWSLKSVSESCFADPFSGSDKEAQEELERRLKQSIADQMIADVPLGAFLSGGVDSSIVVALMQAQSTQAVKTFSIGFNEQNYNEAIYAKEVAKVIGTDHTELYVSSDEALKVIPKLPSIFDEPFSDSSQIPTYLVSSLARQKVTVSLSGDGGDEVFGGYNRHYWGGPIWNKLKRYPLLIRKIISQMMCSVSPDKWGSIYKGIEHLLPRRYQVALPEDKIRKLLEILPVDNPESMYRELISHWKVPEEIVIGSAETQTIHTDRSQWVGLADFENRMMFMDTMTYLPDDILTKVDRAAMSVSLETRIPMLDHRVIEFAWRLPLDMKIRNGQGKWLLKQVLSKYLPGRLIERPKMGFGIPLDSWLRGPLRDWGESLLDKSRLSDEGFFDSKPIRKKWDEHVSGKRNWQYHLWDVLMFQAWLEENR